jgi:hypothetical protein
VFRPPTFLLQPRLSEASQRKIGYKPRHPAQSRIRYLIFDCKSNYLSFGSAPSFLRDTDNTLFGYFGMLLWGLMESFSDADVQLNRFLEAQNLVRDYGKIARGERWEKDAAFRARRHFRDMLIALQAGLDNFSDLVALF